MQHNPSDLEIYRFICARCARYSRCRVRRKEVEVKEMDHGERGLLKEEYNLSVCLCLRSQQMDHQDRVERAHT